MLHRPHLSMQTGEIRGRPALRSFCVVLSCAAIFAAPSMAEVTSLGLEDTTEGGPCRVSQRANPQSSSLPSSASTTRCRSLRD